MMTLGAMGVGVEWLTPCVPELNTSVFYNSVRVAVMAVFLNFRNFDVSVFRN